MIHLVNLPRCANRIGEGIVMLEERPVVSRIYQKKVVPSGRGSLGELK